MASATQPSAANPKIADHKCLHTDGTQHCQLCHYNIVVAQLAVLGFIKSV
jgi:hypothetical protein